MKDSCLKVSKLIYNADVLKMRKKFRMRKLKKNTIERVHAKQTKKRILKKQFTYVE